MSAEWQDKMRRTFSSGELLLYYVINMASNLVFFVAPVVVVRAVDASYIIYTTGVCNKC